MQRFKVAINATILDDKPTGLGVVTLNIINSLPSLLPEVEFVVYTPSKMGITSSSNVNIKLVSIFLQSSKFGRLSGIYRFFWNQFILFFLSRKYDLIYSTTPHGSFLLRKQIITIHDLISIKKDRTYKTYNLQAVYYKLFLPLTIKRCVKVITVSEYTKREVIKYFNCKENRVRVVYNAYNSDLFNNLSTIKKEFKVNRPFILSVGATYPHKNLEYLIRVFNQLKDNIDYDLYIVGGKVSYISTLQKLVDLFKLEHRIVIKRYVSDENLVALYRQAFCFVYPSLEEGFGLPLLESMACDCPVISSDISCLKEIAGDAAYFINPLDESSLKKAILNITSNEEMRDKLVMKGKAQIQKYSWEKTAKEIASEILNYLKR